MARKPNYGFERMERERAKAAKKAARQEAKREKTEKRKAEAAGLDPDAGAPESEMEGDAVPASDSPDDSPGEPRAD